MEDAVATMFAARTGVYIRKSSKGDWIAADTTRDHLRVSPDRILFYPGEKHSRKNQHILECKTSSISIDRNDIPTYWYCQLNHGMVIDRMGPTRGQTSVTSRPGKDLYIGKPHPLSLESLLKEAAGGRNFELPGKKEDTVISAGGKTEEEPLGETAGELDSVVLARTLVYLGQCNAHVVNISQIQIILYNAYGVYLARNGKRLIDEHPQMWEYGPVFPKAYNKLRRNPSDGEIESETLKKTRPEVYQFLSQCFQLYAWTSASMLSATHLASDTPWAKIRKKSPDKWGVQIDDTLIEEWFKGKMGH